ncbi:hypothetical protein JTE90_012286 [Oedothorax gibbosus]|uniref:Uncharacterized protein n=1 Tax=Oedothorax gibbosus TaxID=931172 RepID=A0AAV6VI76_9ARAC|nr:hypothetical protein JTE90_012286 [Oedothorax gibbosus]
MFTSKTNTSVSLDCTTIRLYPWFVASLACSKILVSAFSWFENNKFETVPDVEVALSHSSYNPAVTKTWFGFNLVSSINCFERKLVSAFFILKKINESIPVLGQGNVTIFDVASYEGSRIGIAFGSSVRFNGIIFVAIKYYIYSGCVFREVL